MFAFSGHKMYAPFGSGALIAKKGLLRFDHDEGDRIRSSGEENVVGIASMGKAITLLQRIGMDVLEKEERSLTSKMIRALKGVKGVEVFGTTDTHSPNFRSRSGVIAFRFTSVPHNLAAKELAEVGGMGTRGGCFCAHLLVKYIARIHPIRIYAAKILFLIAPRLTKKILPGLVRMSLGIENIEGDIDHAIRTIEAVADKPRSRINKALGSSHNGTPFLGSTQTEKLMREFVRAVERSVFSR
jgi:selenocysteine lyase/cysteine desulfurase